jgi:phage/plasmid-like protein (TIGR03299 family)
MVLIQLYDWIFFLKEGIYMAHMIMENDSMFSVREKPWHGLGTILDNAPNSFEAMKQANLTWKVETHNVIVDNNVVNGYIANVRSDTKKCLGIVSDRYKIVQNEEAFQFTDALLEFDVKYETAGSLENGKRIWLLAKVPDTTILNDKMENYLLFTNSHDGKASIRVASTAIRVVCNNTLNLALDKAKRTWSTKHMGRIQNKMAECAKILDLNNAYMNALRMEAERLAMKKTTNNEIKKWIETLFPISENDSKRMKTQNELARDMFTTYYLNSPDIDNFKGSVWHFIQASSDFAYHARPIRLTDTYKENQLAKAIDGNVFLDTVYTMVG